MRAAVADDFADEVMGRREGCHLRHVRDRDDLVAGSQFAHFPSDCCGDFAADIGIDFVEDEQRDIVLRSEGAFDGEHDAAHFSGGSDDAQGFGRLAGIRGEHEFGFFGSVGTRLGQRVEVHGEFCFAEAEVGEVAADFAGEARGGFAAELREGGGGGIDARAGGREGGGEAFQFAAAVLHAAEFGGSGVAVVEHAFDGSTVLPLQRFEEVDAVLEFCDFAWIGFEVFLVVAEAAPEVLEFHEGGFEGGCHFRGAAVRAFEIAEDAAEFPQLAKDGAVAFTEKAERLACKVGQFRAVGCDAVALEQGFLLVPARG
jgi:hypothetical protein